MEALHAVVEEKDQDKRLKALDKVGRSTNLG
jgi:hypothetical protein